MRFDGKRVLVTGAGSGIGRATAVLFASEGAQVVLADINLEGLEATKAAMGDSGGNAVLHTFDVSDREQCFATVDLCVAEMGGLDVLCNIAGIAMCRHFTEITEGEWNTMLGVNLTGVFFMCQAAIPELLKGGGNIVNMSSTAGLTGLAYHGSYCATKGGVAMMTKSLAMEFGKRGVRANAICPGSVNTPLTATFSLPDNVDMELFGRLLPLYDSAQPEEIAAAVCYLASDDARFVNGAALPIDSGQTAG